MARIPGSPGVQVLNDPGQAGTVLRDTAVQNAVGGLASAIGQLGAQRRAQAAQREFETNLTGFQDEVSTALEAAERSDQIEGLKDDLSNSLRQKLQKRLQSFQTSPEAQQMFQTRAAAVYRTARLQAGQLQLSRERSRSQAELELFSQAQRRLLQKQGVAAWPMIEEGTATAVNTRAAVLGLSGAEAEVLENKILEEALSAYAAQLIGQGKAREYLGLLEAGFFDRLARKAGAAEALNITQSENAANLYSDMLNGKDFGNYAKAASGFDAMVGDGPNQISQSQANALKVHYRTALNLKDTEAAALAAAAQKANYEGLQMELDAILQVSQEGIVNPAGDRVPLGPVTIQRMLEDFRARVRDVGQTITDDVPGLDPNQMHRLLQATAEKWSVQESLKTAAFQEMSKEQNQGFRLAIHRNPFAVSEEDVMNDPLLDDGQKADRLAQLETRREQLGASLDLLERGGQILDGRPAQASDPDDVKAIDAIYTAEIGRMGIDPSDMVNAIPVAMEIGNRAGFVPDSFIKAALAAFGDRSSNTSPEVRLAAAKALWNAQQPPFQMGARLQMEKQRDNAINMRGVSTVATLDETTPYTAGITPRQRAAAIMELWDQEAGRQINMNEQQLAAFKAQKSSEIQQLAETDAQNPYPKFAERYLGDVAGDVKLHLQTGIPGARTLEDLIDMAGAPPVEMMALISNHAELYHHNGDTPLDALRKAATDAMTIHGVSQTFDDDPVWTIYPVEWSLPNDIHPEYVNGILANVMGKMLENAVTLGTLEEYARGPSPTALSSETSWFERMNTVAGALSRSEIDIDAPLESFRRHGIFGYYRPEEGMLKDSFWQTPLGKTLVAPLRWSVAAAAATVGMGSPDVKYSLDWMREYMAERNPFTTLDEKSLRLEDIEWLKQRRMTPVRWERGMTLADVPAQIQRAVVPPKVKLVADRNNSRQELPVYNVLYKPQGLDEWRKLEGPDGTPMIVDIRNEPLIRKLNEHNDVRARAAATFKRHAAIWAPTLAAKLNIDELSEADERQILEGLGQEYVEGSYTNPAVRLDAARRITDMTVLQGPPEGNRPDAR